MHMHMHTDEIIHINTSRIRLEEIEEQQQQCAVAANRSSTKRNIVVALITNEHNTTGSKRLVVARLPYKNSEYRPHPSLS